MRSVRLYVHKWDLICGHEQSHGRIGKILRSAEFVLVEMHVVLWFLYKSKTRQCGEGDLHSKLGLGSHSEFPKLG